MGRYANALLPWQFPDLSEDGDMIYVTIRNPKTVPLEQLTAGMDQVGTGPDGQPDVAQANAASFRVMADLIHDWHVYDATIAGDSDPLPLPATPEMVRKLPMEITQWIMKRITDVMSVPQ